METTATPTVRFNTQLMAEDMAAKAWTMAKFGEVAGVSGTTVKRFLSGEFQTNPTAGKLAKALGHQVERYILREGAGLNAGGEQ